MTDIARPSQLERRLVALTLLLIPVNWLLGTTLLWIYPVGVILLVANDRLAPVEWILVHLFLALSLALAIAMMAGAPGERAAAAVYNLTIIAMMLGYMSFGRRIMSLPLEVRTRALYGPAVWVAFIQLAAVGAAWLYTRATHQTVVDFPSFVLGRIGSLPGVLNDYATAKVSVADWVGDGEVARLVGFGIYATEGAYLILVIGLLGALHAVLRGRIMLAIVIEVLTAMALIAAASRTTLLASLLSLALFAPFFGRTIKVAGLLLAPILLIGAGTLAAYGPEMFADTFSSVNSARAGSSEERFRSYSLAIEMVTSTNLFTGLGIKPRDESLLTVPIGSHSSFVSMFTKGGLLALGVFMLMWAYALAQIIGSQLRLIATPGLATAGERLELIYLSRAVLCSALWWMTEDFDAPAHHAVLAGLCIGLVAQGARNLAARGPARAVSATRSDAFANRS